MRESPHASSRGGCGTYPISWVAFMHTKMNDIDDFAARVVEDFCRSQQVSQRTHGDRFNLGISNDAVEGLIKAVFYASLIPDEGRYPEVCLMCYRKGSEQA